MSMNKKEVEEVEKEAVAKFRRKIFDFKSIPYEVYTDILSENLKETIQHEFSVNVNNLEIFYNLSYGQEDYLYFEGSMYFPINYNNSELEEIFSDAFDYLYHIQKYAKEKGLGDPKEYLIPIQIIGNKRKLYSDCDFQDIEMLVDVVVDNLVYRMTTGENIEEVLKEIFCHLPVFRQELLEDLELELEGIEDEESREYYNNAYETIMAHIDILDNELHQILDAKLEALQKELKEYGYDYYAYKEEQEVKQAFWQQFNEGKITVSRNEESEIEVKKQ